MNYSSQGIDVATLGHERVLSQHAVSGEIQGKTCTVVPKDIRVLVRKSNTNFKKKHARFGIYSQP